MDPDPAQNLNWYLGAPGLVAAVGRGRGRGGDTVLLVWWILPGGHGVHLLYGGGGAGGLPVNR